MITVRSFTPTLLVSWATLCCACAPEEPPPPDDDLAISRLGDEHDDLVIDASTVDAVPGDGPRDAGSGSDAAEQACFCPSKNQEEVTACEGTIQRCFPLSTKETCTLQSHPMTCKQTATCAEKQRGDTGCKWTQIDRDHGICESTGTKWYFCDKVVVEPKIEVRNDRCPSQSAAVCNSASCEVRVSGGEWFDNACTTTRF